MLTSKLLTLFVNCLFLILIKGLQSKMPYAIPIWKIFIINRNRFNIMELFRFPLTKIQNIQSKSIVKLSIRKFQKRKQRNRKDWLRIINIWIWVLRFSKRRKMSLERKSKSKSRLKGNNRNWGSSSSNSRESNSRGKTEGIHTKDEKGKVNRTLTIIIVVSNSIVKIKGG